MINTKDRYARHERNKEILVAIAKMGFIISLAVLAPNAAGHILKLVGVAPNRKSYMATNRSLKNLEKKGYLHYKTIGKRKFLEMTLEGRNYLDKLTIKDIILPKKKSWDRKWRLVTFDIPEELAENRRKFWGTLKVLGMYRLEKSIFIYPYECRENVDKISRILSINKFVRYMVADFIDKDLAAKKFFKLSSA